MSKQGENCQRKSKKATIVKCIEPKSPPAFPFDVRKPHVQCLSMILTLHPTIRQWHAAITIPPKRFGIRFQQWQHGHFPRFTIFYHQYYWKLTHSNINGRYGGRIEGEKTVCTNNSPLWCNFNCILLLLTANSSPLPLASTPMSEERLSCHMVTSTPCSRRL